MVERGHHTQCLCFIRANDKIEPTYFLTVYPSETTANTFLKRLVLKQNICKISLHYSVLGVAWKILWRFRLNTNF